MASARAPSSRLLALPDPLLGLIFEELEDGVDRMAFMHTCKHLHNNQECLSKITRVTLFLDKSEHGSIHKQLSTVIPGSAITFMHQRLLHQIKGLELDEMCAIKDAPNIRAFVHCLRECMPDMKHLTVGSVAEESAMPLLSELPQLQLNSLNLTITADDLSLPGTGCLSQSDFFVPGQLQTLQHLIIHVQNFSSNFAPFTNLSCLQSFCVFVDFKFRWGGDEGNSFAGAVGLNSFLACVPNLTYLRLPCLSETRSSESVRCIWLEECDMVELPTRATMPPLMHLDVFHLSHDPGRSQAQLEDALDGLANISLDCEHFRLTSDARRCSCAGFLHALSSRGFIFASVKGLMCTNTYIRSGDLSQLAACFPNVEGLFLKDCCFVPANVISEICDFSVLQSCTIRGIDEVFDEEVELEEVVEEDACSFGNFCEGLEDACAAAQAKRHSSLPPLHIELINFTDTYFREHIFDTVERVYARIHESEEDVKVWLGSSTDYDDYYYS
ncbi:hypothetical protein DUNSADRAFT_10523 [Dunaliella salina]|uniref:F-box domain-containing protein n=1 Tax=Dunaliella salina TaxID=3046 RepID=A0ABQ7GF62_DUNSA|nr:hypothetical protein DUNSADRAFT_10523 [Dunaliella salina]|eukprot:KAF5833243.1 hypothetical protein DUNSADRAFT_10523 [Dunaliella salina]